MFDHLLGDNKGSNIGFDEEIHILELKICALSGALSNNNFPLGAQLKLLTLSH